MKAIMEYQVSGNNINGKVRHYQMNTMKLPKLNAIAANIESVEDSKRKEYSDWEKYDYYLDNVIKDNPKYLSPKILKEIKKQKEEYIEMKDTKSFYSNEELEEAYEEVTKLYKDLIKTIERTTNTKYGIDYTLD